MALLSVVLGGTNAATAPTTETLQLNIPATDRTTALATGKAKLQAWFGTTTYTVQNITITSQPDGSWMVIIFATATS